MVFGVDDAVLGGVGAIEGRLHGGAFNEPVCEWEILVDNYDYGDPKKEANHPSGQGAAAEASVEGGRLLRYCTGFRDSFQDNFTGVSTQPLRYPDWTLGGDMLGEKERRSE